MVSVAILSNPKSTGNQSLLPRVRSFCADRPDVFHYEVERAEDIGDALRAIARVKPQVLAINGGDGTVQAALTGLHLDDPFAGAPPPVAVLPNGKTNLIALDLGAEGDPLAVLERIIALAETGLDDHIVQRQLIALTEGDTGNRPVLGMFLGGAGLAETILYCRNTIYPLGLPNGVSHFIAAVAVFASLFFGFRGKYFPPSPHAVRVTLGGREATQRRFAFLVVTTLEKLLFGSTTTAPEPGLKFMAVERSGMALMRALIGGMRGHLGQRELRGVHVSQDEFIRIDSERSSVILDGEEFEARPGRPILLRSTPPVPFLSLVA